MYEEHRTRVTQTMCRSLNHTPPCLPAGLRTRGPAAGAAAPRAESWARPYRGGTQRVPSVLRPSQKRVPDRAANRPRAPRGGRAAEAAAAAASPPGQRAGAARVCRPPGRVSASHRAWHCSPRPCPPPTRRVCEQEHPHNHGQVTAASRFVLPRARGCAKAEAVALFALTRDWSLHHPGQMKCGN